MKKRFLSMLLAAGMMTSVMAPAMVNAEETQADAPVKRAILDTDMGYLNDDAIVMFMLSQADSLGMCDFLLLGCIWNNGSSSPAGINWTGRHSGIYGM